MHYQNLSEKSMPSATYIFGEREYVLTGREATKKMRSGRSEEKVEIRPVDVSDHSDRTFNKWVKMSELFLVHDGEEE